MKHLTYFLLAFIISSANLNAQNSKSLCGVNVNSAVSYSKLNRFKISFSNVNASKTITSIEFMVQVQNSFGENIGSQTEIWETGWDSPLQPGKSEYILRSTKIKDMSRINVSVIRVKYADGSKCNE